MSKAGAGKSNKLELENQLGDPRAVAKQQIFAESVKAELKHLAKNRTTDFVLNPTQSKLIQYNVTVKS